MTLHSDAIDWLVTIIPNATNNHYAFPPVKVENRIPDIIAKKSYHEVEVVSDKGGLAKIKLKKVLWVVIPSYEVFNEINLLGKKLDGIFEPFATIHIQIPRQNLLKAYSTKEDLKLLRRKILRLEERRQRLIGNPKGVARTLQKRVNLLKRQLKELKEEINGFENLKKLALYDTKRLLQLRKQLKKEVGDLSNLAVQKATIAYEQNLEARAEWYKTHSEDFEWG